MAAENDRGGGGDATPMGRRVEEGSYPSDGFKFWPNRPVGCRVMGVGVSSLGGRGSSRNRSFEWRPGRNDRGGGGNATPMGRRFEEGSYSSDGFKFRPNRPVGCRVMDMGALELGGRRFMSW